MKNTTTAIRLDNHEQLCRIMQKQTHYKINPLATQINTLEKILIGAAALIISGLGMNLKKKIKPASRLNNKEILCEIMKKQKHNKINSYETQFNRLEKILKDPDQLIVIE